MPCLFKKASRCATDHTSKTTFFIFCFLYNTKILQKNHVYCYLIGSVVKIALYLHFLYTKDDTLRQIKKKHEWWNNCFSDVFTYCLNLKHFASLFFLAKDNFMFWIKSLFFFLSTLAIKWSTVILEKMFSP